MSSNADRKMEKFELFFEKYNIKPIVGVIPKNKDNKLGDSYDKNFWRKVKDGKI